MPNEFEQILQEGADQLDVELQNQLIRQGHHLTGALEKSIKNQVTDSGEVVNISGTIRSYGIYLNAGVRADRIPFKQGSGAPTSKYIEGLTMFWKLKGKSDKEALSLAFATAKVQKKEGMPTSGSYAFTETGLRKGFINEAIKDSGLDRRISKGLDVVINNKYHEVPNETI